MKSRLFKLVAAGWLAATALSCEDFLDRQPLSQQVAVENAGDSLVFKTADDVEAALSGVYADFKSEYYMLDYFVNGDAQSDDAYAGADNPANFQIDDYKIEATNSNIARDWAYLYSMIGKANQVLTHIGRVADPALATVRKNEIIGEASFIRAFAYFQLVQLFGDVPLVTQQVLSISSSNLEEIYPLLFPDRVPAANIYSQIITDLETALAYARTDAPDKGFATKGSANAMLAKVYATVEPHDWIKVSQYCDAVIAGGYSLLPEFDQLWDNAHENSSESIFEINCYGWDTGGNWGVFMFYGADWKKFDIPSNDLVKAFEDESDLVRLAATIEFMDVTGKWTDQRWPLVRYPFIRKYRDFSGAQNFILIRLADILLLKAEALNELNNVSGAKVLVDQVRARVDLAPVVADTQAAMRLAIEKERRLELAFEGHRWYDLKRTNRAVTVMSSVKDGSGNSLGYALTDSKLVWPIPQDERDKNTRLTQNPGY